MTAPYDIAAEQSVLGALMYDAHCFDVVGDKLRADSFQDGRHRFIYEAVGALIVASRPTDPVSVFEALKARNSCEEAGGLVYLMELANSVPSARNAQRHAEIVAERAMNREMVAAADMARELASAPGVMTEKLDQIAAIFGGLESRTMAKVPRLLGDVMLERTQHYTDLAQGDIQPGWRTGIPTLDHRLGGGLKPGKLVILAARPSVGKSSFSMNIATNMGHDGRVCLFLSQEMPVEELADRVFSSTGAIDQDRIQTGKFQDEDWSRITEAIERNQNSQIFVDDQPALNITEVRAKARRIRGLQVLVLDYLQLCSSGLKGDNRNAQIEEISRGLKALAQSMGICIIALSQLNREVEKRPGKRPQLSDLRDSGSIEQDADVVMFLWPLKESNESSWRVVGCDLAKVRGGRKGAFCLNFDGSRQRWTESTEGVDSFAPQKVSGKGFE